MAANVNLREFQRFVYLNGLDYDLWRDYPAKAIGTAYYKMNIIKRIWWSNFNIFECFKVLKLRYENYTLNCNNLCSRALCPTTVRHNALAWPFCWGLILLLVVSQEKRQKLGSVQSPTVDRSLKARPCRLNELLWLHVHGYELHLIWLGFYVHTILSAHRIRGP